jgi:hypothetical protein
MHKHDDFKYIGIALNKMNLWPLITFEEDYLPELVSQFFCTTYFHNTPQRHISWMLGGDQITIDYDQFQSALGYAGALRGGFRIHSEWSMHEASIAFCYPSVAPQHPIP